MSSSLADRITEVMAYFNLNQGQLAEKVGLTQQSISGYMSGKREMPTKTANAFEAKLDVRSDWIQKGHGMMLLQERRNLPDDLKELVDLWPRLSESDRLRVLGYAEGILAEKVNGKKT